MKKHYCNAYPHVITAEGWNQYQFLFFILIFCLLLILINSTPLFSQGVIPTKGKDFWIGFPYNPEFSSSIGTRRCDVFITSDISTNGIISIPQQGWSQPFTITANQTTTISLPIPQVEHTTSEVIENKGVEIISQDTISVFAITFQKYTADATVVYPKQSLGTEYRISSYRGLYYTSPGNLNSDLQIVATEDGTQVSIIPTSPTLYGKPAGVPFTVNLNAGESYQVMADNASDDLTGTVIKGTDSSGSCRPFAVFSGSACVNIPNGCYACDVLYEQAIPVANWGKTYYAVPFSFASDYTLRILADLNNTSYSIDGGPPSTLNAGQFTEINGIGTTRCISANKPVSVIQYMQGITCVGAGDPSMMYLNSQEQKIDRVTFSTVTSTIITQHNVNVIMNTAHIGQLMLDGASVPSSSFTPMNYCSSISYASLSLTQGSHTLSADSGFTAYIYGTGSAESYAFSVGSFSKTQPIHVDSILCTSDTVHIGTTSLLFSSWWSANTNPNDTIATGPVLTLIPPVIPDIYIEHGFEYISGCPKNYYFNIEIPDPPVAWVTQSADTVCQNQQVQLEAGTIPVSSIYQYHWSPSTGLNNPNISNPVATATTSMWYTVAISSPDGCGGIVYDSIYLTVMSLPLPNASAGGNQSICPGSSATLSASGGISYLWNPGGLTTNTITVSPAVTTNYIVYVTDINGCVNSDTVNISMNPLPNANAGNDQSICAGTSTTLTATGGISFLWIPGGNTGNTIVVNPSASTNYIVQVTGSNGCTKNDTVLIAVNPLPVAYAGINQTICSGASATLTASGGASYTWMPGGYSTNIITVTPSFSTTFVVFVTGMNGCINRDTVSVNVNQTPVANAGVDQTICSGDSAILSASGGSFYSWIPGGGAGSQMVVSPLASTSYIVQVSDLTGCVDQDTVLVHVNLSPVANAGPDLTICSGDTILLVSLLTGVTSLWFPGGITGNALSVCPALSTTYFLEITDTNGCRGTDTVTIYVNPVAVANAGTDQNSCIGIQSALTATGGVSYLWFPGGDTTGSISVSPAITTDYIVKATDLNGCMDYDTVTVYVKPFITGTSTTRFTCYGNSILLTDSGGITFLWSPGGYTNDSIFISPQASMAYYVYITEANGCEIHDTIAITVNPLPAADAGTDQEICKGSAALLTASGGFSYQWITTGSLNASVLVSPDSSMNYVVNITDTNGCRNNDTVYVQVNPLPHVNAGPDQAICPGDSVILSATGGNSYFWNPGGGTGSSIIVSPGFQTSYMVVAQDSNGCKNTDTVSVILNPVPNAAFNLSAPVCEQSLLSFANISAVSTGIIAYNNWNFGDGSFSTFSNPGHSYSSAGNYIIHLSVISNMGCTDSTTQKITVNPVPVVNFSAQNVCAESPDEFTDLSIISSGNISQWFWDFGDGATQAGYAVTHIYLQSGLYDISLTSISDSGCSATSVRENAIEIYPLPVANFMESQGMVSIMQPAVQFTDESMGETKWLWNFGDLNGISTLENPSYSYNDTGIFKVILIVTSSSGCTDTANGEVYVEPEYTFYFPNAFTPNDDNKNDSFGPVGTGLTDFEIFIFDRWGKNIFHSDNLSVSWNGKTEGTNVKCNEGVYVYYARVTDFRNIRHAYQGQVTLIR